MKLFKFVFSKWFIINLAVALLLFVLGVFGVLSHLDKLTRHGETIEVPDLKAMTIEHVETSLGELGLKYKVIDSSAYTKKLPKKSVVKQDPAPGSLVKLGRVIYLTANPNGYRYVKVPELIDETSRRAYVILKSKGFNLGRFEYREDIGKNRVLEMKYNGEVIEAGKELPKQSSIDLVLGYGSGDKTTNSPNLIGKSRSEAEKILVELSLNRGKVRYDGLRNDTLNYFVYQQEPKYSRTANLDMGTVVNFWLTTDSLKLPSLEMEQDSTDVN